MQAAITSAVDRASPSKEWARRVILFERQEHSFGATIEAGARGMASQDGDWDVDVWSASDLAPSLLSDFMGAIRSRGLGVRSHRLDGNFSAIESPAPSCVIVFTAELMRGKGLPELLAQFVESSLSVGILAGIGQDQVEMTLDSCGLMGAIETHGVTLYPSTMECGAIADSILATVAPRAVVSMTKLKGPVDVLVLGDSGQLVVGTFVQAPIANDVQLRVIDFRGNELSPQDLSGDPGRGVDLVGQATSSVVKQFDQDVTLVGVNHPHMQFFTPQQIEAGSVLNLGTNADPLVLFPFFTCGPFTAGILSDQPSDLEFVNQRLEIAAGSWNGSWKKIVCESGTFTVFGKN